MDSPQSGLQTALTVQGGKEIKWTMWITVIFYSFRMVSFFLLPVCCLDRVMDAEKPEEEAEAAECNILAGALGGNGKRRYRILLHKEASEEKLLLPADDIIDLREINDEQILELTEPVLNERNRYLIAVAVTETQEGRRIPAYILDPACLSGEQ